MTKTGIFRGLSIQVLDDNPFYARLMEKQLLHYLQQHFAQYMPRIRVTSYTDYREYLQALPLSYSISFIDYYLGNGMTGIDLLEAISKQSSYCKVIIMTDENNLHVVRSCIEKGASGFVFKDNSALELCHPIIRDAINNSNFP